MAKHLDIRLDAIVVSKSNEMFRDENDLTQDALKELTDSIREHGVIQPILVRPLADGKKYELVCGERRYRASGYAALSTVPATVRELTNEEAFALQVTENLQRKDVHPLREAHAYKYLFDKDKANTISELALKFGKTEHYIQTRLKLNDLIADAKKDFFEGIMTIGHALLLARLTPDDQKKAIERCTQWLQREGKKVRFYNTVSNLEEFINAAVICNLGTAAFPKDDTNLIPKAGPCSTCPKRSGANQLFADVKEKDRCFDRKCFMAKRLQFMISQLEVMIDKEPDLVFLQSRRGDKVDPRIDKILKENKIKLLTESDFNTWNNSHAKMKGIYVNGDEVGHRATVYSNTASKKAKSQTPEKVDAKEAIARINERLERAKELDKEKIYTRTIELAKESKTFNQIEIDRHNYGFAEKGMIAKIIYDAAGYTTRQEIDSKFGLNKIKRDSELATYFKQMSPHQLSFMVRQIAITNYSASTMHDSTAGFLLADIAREFDVPVTDIWNEQEQAAIKRKQNADKRKRELQASIAKTPAKKVTKAKKGLSSLLK
jgi:ParB/RepB/Spo0J family partition protein